MNESVSFNIKSNSPSGISGTATIIGGGIIGLSSAYYLRRSGWDVTILDKSDFLDNCSYGNAGYVCPSHFIPLSSPGIVKQGSKWMWNSKSPFYIQPRINGALFDWGSCVRSQGDPSWSRSENKHFYLEQALGKSDVENVEWDYEPSEAVQAIKL